MAVSKRTRFEVLRRDNYTCRYCGSAAPDVQLTVDHVTPVTLGGGDEPSNLVTACQPCNSGKASTSPDEHIVEDVDASAMLFAKALEQVARERVKNSRRVEDLCDRFIDEAWPVYASGPLEGEPVVMDSNWRTSIERFIAAGLVAYDLWRFAEIATRSGVRSDELWRYFCGCCWKEITTRQELARQLIEDGAV